MKNPGYIQNRTQKIPVIYKYENAIYRLNNENIQEFAWVSLSEKIAHKKKSTFEFCLLVFFFLRADPIISVLANSWLLMIFKKWFLNKSSF